MADKSGLFIVHRCPICGTDSPQTMYCSLKCAIEEADRLSARVAELEANYAEMKKANDDLASAVFSQKPNPPDDYEKMCHMQLVKTVDELEKENARLKEEIESYHATKNAEVPLKGHSDGKH